MPDATNTRPNVFPPVASVWVIVVNVLSVACNGCDEKFPFHVTVSSTLPVTVAGPGDGKTQVTV